VTLGICEIVNSTDRNLKQQEKEQVGVDLLAARLLLLSGAGDRYGLK